MTGQVLEARSPAATPTCPRDGALLRKLDGECRFECQSARCGRVWRPEEVLD